MRLIDNQFGATFVVNKKEILHVNDRKIIKDLAIINMAANVSDLIARKATVEIVPSNGGSGSVMFDMRVFVFSSQELADLIASIRDEERLYRDKITEVQKDLHSCHCDHCKKVRGEA